MVQLVARCKELAGTDVAQVSGHFVTQSYDHFLGERGVCVCVLDESLSARQKPTALVLKAKVRAKRRSARVAPQTLQGQDGGKQQ